MEVQYPAGVAPGADPAVTAAAVAEVPDVVGPAPPFEQSTDRLAGPERQQQPEVLAVDEALRVRRAEPPLQLPPEQADQAAVHDVERRVLDRRLPVSVVQVCDPRLDPRLRLQGLPVEGRRAAVAEQRGVEEVAYEVVARADAQCPDVPGQDRVPDRVFVGAGSADLQPPTPAGDARPPSVPAAAASSSYGSRARSRKDSASASEPQKPESTIQPGRRPTPPSGRIADLGGRRLCGRPLSIMLHVSPSEVSRAAPDRDSGAAHLTHTPAYPPRRSRSACSFSVAGINSPQARS